jgi:hypothetical protein
VRGPLPLVLLAACFAVLFIAAGGHHALRKVWRFQRSRRRWGKSGGASFATTGQQKKTLVADLRDVRDFAFNLQLGTSMEATLSGALTETAEQFAARKGIFGERLKRQVDAKLASSPEDVIRGLAEDFDSLQLREMLDRLAMAREGGVSYERALAISVDSIEEDIRAQVEHEIQQAQTKLTVPMVVGVFGPPLVIGILPLIARMLGILSR